MTKNNQKGKLTFKEWLAELDRCIQVDFGFPEPLVPTLEMEEWKEIHNEGGTPRKYIEEMMSYADLPEEG